MKTEIFAHRGFHLEEPENSLPAFKAAIKAEADGIEIDVQRSMDGYLMVMHDEKVDRTTNGKGRLKDFTLKELKKFRMKDPKHRKQAIRIPTFEEFFETINKIDFAGTLLIELKTNRVEYLGIEQQVLDELKMYNTKNLPIILQSFNQKTLMNIKHLDPTMPLARLVYWRPLLKRWYDRLFVVTATLHPDIKFLRGHPWRMRTCRTMRPWLVNRPTELENIFKMHFKGVITDQVALAVALRKRVQK